jgi:tetratricopeptide (TPR) repeat protein
LGAMIVDDIKQNGTYSFLRAYKKDGANYLLFRLFTNNGINYHEFEVKQDKDKFKIIDAYLFLSGEKMSETIARVYNSFRLLNTASIADSLSYLQALSELEKIKVLASKGKFSKAYKKWQTLPLSFMKDKLFLITGIQIASYLDDKTYLKAYNQFVSNFPNNSGKYLIPLDGLLIHKNYSMALACVDSLDNSLNNDPMLNYLRGNLLYEMGNYTEAAKKMSVLIESIPDFETGYYSLLGLYVKNKNYIEATQVLDKIVLTFNYYKDDFSPILKEYPDFINSEEYQVWLNQ